VKFPFSPKQINLSTAKNAGATIDLVEEEQ